MRVLVTGITGFVGRHLAAELVSRGHDVWGASTDENVSLDGVQLIRADITDPVDMTRMIIESDPKAVIHLAGMSSVGDGWKRPGDCMEINFVGTRNVLDAAEGRRIVVASSSEVYGKVPESQQPIHEDQQANPVSPYAMTKACAEVLALDRAAIIVRSFNSIGPGQAKKFVLPSFAAQLVAIEQGIREPVLKVGNLIPRRDFVHVADAARAYRLILEEGQPASVYNIASGKAFSIEEVLNRLREISGVEAEVEVDEEKFRKEDIPQLLGCNQRLRDLGWQPEYGLDDALRQIWHEARAAHGEDR